VEAVDSVVVERGVAGLAATACVRVHNGAGEVVGSAFAVGPDLVATCAHVVAAATGADPYAEAAPAGPLAVDFPMLSDAPARRSARVHRWVPIAEDGSGDVALLRLDTPAPTGAVMPPVRRVEGLWDHRFRVFGFPDGSWDGVWTTGRIRDRQGTGWFQLQGSPGDQPIVGGFSGSPVWDDETGAVVGMTVAADRDPSVTTAYLIPVDQVLGLDPELLPNPYRGLQPFDEEHAEYFFGRDDELARLRDAVSRCPLVVVAGPSGAGKSSLVHAGLVPSLRADGARIGRARLSSASTVFAELVAAVLELADPASNPARRARDTERIAGLMADPATRAAAVEELTDALRGATGERFVLILDQFEELAGTDPEAARRLLGDLAALVTAGTGVRAVLTARGGVLDDVLTPDIAKALGSGTVLVGPMDRAALREAIVRPAERAPGLAFEAGLVDRVLDDAGAEPGQLPLVESLLAQLWTRREGGWLTLSAYHDAGGVAGALAAHADDVIRQLPAPDDQLLRTLLARLVTAGRDGRFIRRPVPYAELSPELRVLVPPLVAGRLLVVAGGERTGGTVDLAHQALIDHWPKLRDWLEADRDFLHWRAELDAAQHRWQAADRDNSALLRGPALAAADTWTERAAELTEDEKHYLHSSRARRRYEGRRRRVITAAVAALALAAGTLSVVAVQRGSRITAQQATADAEALAAEANSHAERQPVLAAELALAAWRSDPTNTAAGTALAGRYLAFADTEKIITAQAEPVSISGGGEVVVAGMGRGKVAVFTGVLGDHPVRHDLPIEAAGIQQSDDGRFIAVLARDNAVHLIDVARGVEPRQLAAQGTSARQLAGIDATAGRLGWVDQDPEGRFVLTVHDLDDGATRTTALGPPDVGGVQLTSDPDVVLIRTGTTEEPVLTVRSLASGTVIREVSESWMVNQKYDVRCQPGDGTPGSRSSVAAFDVITGTERRRVPLLSTCSNFWLTEDMHHVLERIQSPADQEHWRATEIESGRSFQFHTPRQPETSLWDPGRPVPKVVLLPAADGRTVALVAVGGTLLRVHASPEPAGGPINLVDAAVHLAGDDYLALTPGGAATYEQGSGRLVASIQRERGSQWLVDDNDLWLLRRGGDRWELTRHPAPALSPVTRIELSPSSLENPNIVVGSSGDGREEIVFELAEGMLSAHDARSGALLGSPIELARTPDERRWYRERDALIGRAGEARQALVSTPNGRLQLWDVPAGRLIHDLPIAGAAYGTAAAAGNRLAVNNATDTVEIWDLVSGERIGEPMPAPGIGSLLGFDAGGRLASTHGSEEERIVLYDIERRVEVATLWPAGTGRVRLADDRSDFLARGQYGILPNRIAGSADRWRESLCRLLPPELSPAARDLLPPGADISSPCRR
jgi:hypothetical protein